MELTPAEKEAVRLRWQKQSGHNTEPPEAEIPRLLEEMRERRREAEAEVLDMLTTATKARGRVRGHQGRLVILFVVFSAGLIALMYVVLLGLNLLRHVNR